MFHGYPCLNWPECKSNSHRLEILSSLCLTSPRFLKDSVGNARTYIIPLQKDLDFSVVAELPPGVSFECLLCIVDVL